MFFRVMYEIFVILLVITYAIVVFADPASHPRLTEEFMNQADVILISFLAAEYVIRLWLAKDKKKFVISNWFDLVAMIPLDHYFYLARFMRILRLVRILRASPFLWSMLKSKPMQRVIGVVTLIMLWSSGAIYLLESTASTKISFISAMLFGGPSSRRQQSDTETSRPLRRGAESWLRY